MFTFMIPNWFSKHFTNTVPESPREVTISEVSITSITLNWKPPEFDGGSPTTGYIIEHKETNSTTWMRSQLTSVTGTSCTVQGLNWMATFMFRVIAENEIGQSQPNELPQSKHSFKYRQSNSHLLC